jgi:hypothetical protein
MEQNIENESNTQPADTKEFLNWAARKRALFVAKPSKLYPNAKKEADKGLLLAFDQLVERLQNTIKTKKEPD